MKPGYSLCVAAAIAASLLLVSPARADHTPTSTIAQIKVIESAHASYSLFHGALWLEVDKATQNYRWGGKQCRGGLSDTSLKLLYDAFRAKHSVTVEYDIKRHKKKTHRCVTSFTVTR